MTRTTIAARFGSMPMCLDTTFGRQHLMTAWPEGPQAVSHPDMIAGADIRVEPGQRYVTLRGVAVMPIRGLLTPDSEMLERYLGWATYAGIEQASAELADDEGVTAVVLDINSPGGYVLGLENAALALQKLAKAKPVYAIANPLAASSAYWLASTANSIAMTAGAMIGCIGVMVEASAPVQPDEDGDLRGVYVSSHARAKWANHTTEAGLAEIARRLNAEEAKFHAAVSAGRGIALDDLPARLSVTDDPADGGAVFGAVDAIARGLADTVETRADFYDRVLAAHAPRPVKPQSRAYLARAAAAQAIARS